MKGVTLIRDDAALFPDAPTLRGLRHVRELAESVSEGFLPYVIFIVQTRGVKYFLPNVLAQPDFAIALREAAERGVKILAYDSIVTETSISVCDSLPIIL